MCEDYDDQYDAAEVLETYADGPPLVNGLAVFEGRVRQLTFEQFKAETLGCGVAHGEQVTNTVHPRTGKTQFMFEGPLDLIAARMNYAECEALALALREKVGTLPEYRAVLGSRTVSLLPGEAMPEGFRKQLSAAVCGSTGLASSAGARRES